MKRHCLWRSLLLLCCFFVPALASAAPLELLTSVSKDPVVPGEGFFYRLMVTNTNPQGGAPLENVRVRWTVPTGLAGFASFRVNGASVSGCDYYGNCYPDYLVTLTIGTLLPGESREVQIPVWARSDIPITELPQPLITEFEGSYTDVEQILADTTQTIVEARTLNVELGATPTPLTPGGELTYTLTFSNTGAQAVNNADLTLRLPAGVTVLDSGGGTPATDRIVWSIDQLNSGTSDRRQVRVKDLMSNEGRVLHAQAEIDDQVGTEEWDTRASLLTPFRNSHPLKLTLAVSDDPLTQGQGFFYRFTATNTNPTSGAPLENVRAWGMVPSLQGIPSGRITGASPSGCDYYGNCYYGSILNLTIGTLLPGESREIQIPVWALTDAPYGQLIPARFFGSYKNDSQEPVIVTDTVAIEQFKALDINLSANPAPLAPLGQFVYELLYGNTGFSAANGSLELTLPDQVQVLDSDGGIQTGNIIVWDNIGPLGSGRGSRRQIVVEDTRGLESRLLQAEARLVDDASFKSWAARSTLATSVKAAIPLSIMPTLSKDPLARSDSFRYELVVANTNPASGAPLENVKIQWIVPRGLNGFSQGNITGTTSVSGCDYYGNCYPDYIVTLTIGTLDPGESREVRIPVTLRDDVIPGTLFETHFIGNANFPNGVNIQQLTATVGALIGEYAVTVPTYDLTVTTTGTGTGAVSSNPAGINCGSDCSQSYPEDASVTLTATPDSNSTFTGWSGACSGSGTCVVTMDAAKNVTATFNNGDPATTLITHYYVSILEREPDEDGLAFWKNQIAEKQAKDEDVKPVFRAMAAFFFFSDEYIGRNTTNIQFLTNLYLTFFQREPDDSGLEFWLVELVGGMSRNQAMQGFLFSPEFTSFMEALGF